LQYEEVKNYFARPQESDFVVPFSAAPICEWQTVPTPTGEEMSAVRFRLIDEQTEFAGFIHEKGRYCFYFVDKNITKIQYLDNGEVKYFHDQTFCEFNLNEVASELRMLQVS
jgi:hypothetical protein